MLQSAESQRVGHDWVNNNSLSHWLFPPGVQEALPSDSSTANFSSFTAGLKCHLCEAYLTILFKVIALTSSTPSLLCSAQFYLFSPILYTYHLLRAYIIFLFIFIVFYLFSTPAGMAAPWKDLDFAHRYILST